MGFGKDGKGVIFTQKDLITLGTLGAASAIKQTTPPAMTEDFRMIKAEIAATMTGHTVGESPIHLYLVNDNLSVAEIAEAIDAEGPLSNSDRIPEERASRAVFLLGTYSSGEAVAPLEGADGQKGVIEKTIRWTFSSSDGWALVAFNDSGAALTTGSVIRLVAKYFGVWVI